ncbi:Metallo-hydrolase/oxidoreductase [Glarea lozoyensis ATCC 20868]|uniref:Metallo-hydrolase/oxidoreductase n=1 Tax=Glarea lozoyensis (strain ATCC 20868 / MF5171) TaxID=1116229 RepID=S3DFS3_GLAL2|nr:Metallo-hydrolase/oxidoreductase [Glarea lozoyensis ATCC 20868]EPE36600.1 Metallo-hydrolase/oxidoreductase [Glarea lozoyensis ATCC 20868]
MAPNGSTKPLTPRPSSKSNVPGSVKQSTKKSTAAKISAKAPTKTPVKPNTSILSFFKKVDSPLKDDSIFISGPKSQQFTPLPRSAPDSEDDELDDLCGSGDGDRYNEVTAPNKKRKVSNETTPIEEKTNAASIADDTGLGMDIDADNLAEAETCTPPPAEPQTAKADRKVTKKPKRRGPFLSDSESDYEQDSKLARDAAVVAEKRELRARVSNQPEELNEVVTTKPIKQKTVKENKPIVPEVESVAPFNPIEYIRRKKVPIAEAQAKWEALRPKNSRSPSVSSSSTDEPPDVESSRREHQVAKTKTVALPLPARMKKEETNDEWGKFDGLDDFQGDMDEFADGEEFLERKWMEEQARLEADEGGLDENPETSGVGSLSINEEIVAACPICDASLGTFTSDEATRHVNGCLDGNPISIPAPLKKEESEVKFMPDGARNRFARKAAVARPGQANPFDTASTSNSGSAFSKIMSGHAEDAAWATAAAAENSSRGKPAYERTCPFYKIMPGFFICVDAFRYGAVQGCNAYFLSHFHSDHYIGLSSSWCHGPIYCSKVTANLVKQQLRVDPKWVVPLDFEKKVEVPGTQGVDITMIPANHCPGSSLFLFEKVIGKGSTPKVQRVLHCGDFRACPAHVSHPLLMPEIVDSISGKTKHQKIDVCYLDTTYLNPRYAFPCQEDVIKACADMCVSLKKERAEESDAWEIAKRERAGSGMAKFVNSTSAIKAEDDSIAMEIGSSKSEKPRGRLLVICGTYSIGKERICMGIARALDCKIWAPPGKMRICAALEDPELMSRMTDDPKEAQIHMQMLMEIRAETLQEYLNSYKPHFSRVVGFRPSGWNYRPPNSRFTDSPSISTIIHSPNWQSSYTLRDLIPQRGSTREASCFGVPYSEHSSFRELTMFVCSLRIEKVVPTVNIGSAATRAKMKAWIERWLAERRKNGCIKVGDGEGEVRW